MTLEEFAALVPGLSGMKHVERIKHFAWFILTQDQRERFETTDIRRCYEQLHHELPANLSQLIQQLASKSPSDVLKDRKGFRLEARIKEQLDARYGQRPATVFVTAMLEGLPGRISDEAERLFLSETILCYKSRAFRAAIVMAWNLAYDHLLNHILEKQLVAFNAAIVRRYPKRAEVAIGKKDDFHQDFKEYDVIEVAAKAGIVSDNTKRILHEKLGRRNMAAHPSQVVFEESQAEDTITDLVNNVILRLS